MTNMTIDSALNRLAGSVRNSANIGKTLDSLAAIGDMTSNNSASTQINSHAASTKNHLSYAKKYSGEEAAAHKNAATAHSTAEKAWERVLHVGQQHRGKAMAASRAARLASGKAYSFQEPKLKWGAGDAAHPVSLFYQGMGKVHEDLAKRHMKMAALYPVSSDRHRAHATAQAEHTAAARSNRQASNSNDKGDQKVAHNNSGQAFSATRTAMGH